MKMMSKEKYEKPETEIVTICGEKDLMIPIAGGGQSGDHGDAKELGKSDNSINIWNDDNEE